MNSAYPQKLTGSGMWDKRGGEEEAELKTVLFRSADELIIEFDFQDWSYLVPLKRTHGQLFRGNWEASHGAERASGTAACRLYKSQDDTLLFGTWVESGITYRWWVTLVPPNDV